MSFQARQGDVLIVKLDKKPETGAPVAREGGRVILAHGEVTGHAHAIEARSAKLYEPATGPKADGLWARALRFLEIGAKKGAELRHEEHGTVNLPPGDFEIRRQREFSIWENRMVAD